MKRTGNSIDYYGIYESEMGKIENKLNHLLIKKEPRSLYEPCSYFLSNGGKRIRPYLVLLSAKAVGGKLSDVYNAAIAVEIVHNFTLVHDDIMDNSDKRRGMPTLHKKYDISTAILAGDSMIALAYESLAKDCKKNIGNIFSIFTHGIIEVCEGQSLDKEYEIRNNVSINEYIKMIYKKTAALIEMSCRIGAEISEAPADQLRAVANFGRNLGIAFQIQDDLLDITGKEDSFGKTIGSDLIEGKKTFLFLRAMEKTTGKEKQALMQVIENKGIERIEIPRFEKIYYDFGIIEDAEREIVKYTKLALRNLNSLPDKCGRDLMRRLANILIHRNK